MGERSADAARQKGNAKGLRVNKANRVSRAMVTNYSDGMDKLSQTNVGGR